MKNGFKKILILLGTRPEAIKLAPIVREIKERNNLELTVCSTGQHKELLVPFLDLFKIEADYNFEVMKENQTLGGLTKRLLTRIEKVLQKERPNLVLVQGDTTTAFVSSLAAYYQKIKIGHVEAGLRSFDKHNPFPEEKNRELIDHLADLHFCPTEQNKKNLLKEGVKQESIFVTGNTVIDSLKWLQNKKKLKSKEEIFSKLDIELRGDKFILATLHRRESFGKDIKNIFEGLVELTSENKEIDVILPLHLNPKVRKPAKEILNDKEGIHLIKPLGYIDFISLLNESYFVVTDSGGVIEEAPAFNKPVLIARKKTERQEATEARCAKLVGIKKEKIVGGAQRLIEEKSTYEEMCSCENPFGDGKAAERIIKIIK